MELARSRFYRRFASALLASQVIFKVVADYFPNVDITQTWQAPYMQPWDPVRSTRSSITVTWTPAWNPWCAVHRYELQARRPKYHPMAFADLESLRFREMDPEIANWPPDDQWTQWNIIYTGVGRAYTFWVPEKTSHAVQFRVRACGETSGQGCSDWSATQTAHTVIGAAVDKINIMVRGTGKNAHGYTVIEVDQRTVYKRRDQTGLLLAVFRRLDFSLQWIKTYDTHRSREQAVMMSNHLKKFNSSYFVVVASSIAWEWHATRQLVQAMEYCGAYHFGQWAYTFAEQMHYSSNFSDLQQSASQAEFGHPYAFIGIPGIGTGMGWESLMYNTGHYLASKVKPQDAVIRGISYYDYVSRMYRLQDIVVSKAPFFLKSQPPPADSLHNPVPAAKQPQSGLMDIQQLVRLYTPYDGTLRNHLTELFEANNTVPPYNFAFTLITDAGIRKEDPRPKTWWVTELEHLWQGASMRYRPGTDIITLIGLPFSKRVCPDFISYNYLFASPESCGIDFVDCCPHVDNGINLTITQCGVGVSPTLCRNSTNITVSGNGRNLIENASFLTTFPYDFRVLDWVA